MGDRVVWRRHGNGKDAGSVAFSVESGESRIAVPGGNPRTRGCEAWYPRPGTVGAYPYDLTSIRL